MEHFKIFVDDEIASLNRTTGIGWRDVLSWREGKGYVLYTAATCMAARVTDREMQYLKPILIDLDHAAVKARIERNAEAFDRGKVPYDREETEQAVRALGLILNPPKIDPARVRTRVRATV